MPDSLRLRILRWLRGGRRATAYGFTLLRITTSAHLQTFIDRGIVSTTCMIKTVYCHSVDRTAHITTLAFCARAVSA